MATDKTASPDIIREFIVETFLFGDGAGLQNDTSFMGSGLIDSMGILQVVEFIEKTFEMKMREDQFIPENLDSIERITRFVNSTLEPQALSVNPEES